MQVVTPDTVEFVTPMLHEVHEVVDRLNLAADCSSPNRFGRCDEQECPVNLNGGKAIRPALALLGAEACNVDPQIALPGATAVEFVHNFSLVHDDLMDRNKQRRHRTTVCAVEHAGIPQSPARDLRALAHYLIDKGGLNGHNQPGHSNATICSAALDFPAISKQLWCECANLRGAVSAPVIDIGRGLLRRIGSGWSSNCHAAHRHLRPTRKRLRTPNSQDRRTASALAPINPAPAVLPHRGSRLSQDTVPNTRDTRRLRNRYVFVNAAKNTWNISSAADLLRTVDSSLSDVSGSVSLAYYDTAHVVQRWLERPDRVPDSLGRPALSILIRRQNDDGSWGCIDAPPIFRLVPTAAAVASLLAATQTAGRDLPMRLQAAELGTKFLVTDVDRFKPSALPDTVTVELIVPALLERISQSLDAVCESNGEYGSTAPCGTATSLWHRYRDGISNLLQLHNSPRGQLRRLRKAVSTRGEVPIHITHYFEILNPESAAQGGPWWDELSRIGQLGASPAATVAGLASAVHRNSRAIDYLRNNADRLGGGQPTILPIAIFEQAWIFASMIKLGFDFPPTLLQNAIRCLAAAVKPEGVPQAPGLPVDTDTTSTVLFVLNHLGVATDPACLLPFATDNGFACYYAAERTRSVVANAHVLEALGWWCRMHPTSDTRYRHGCQTARNYLLATQQPDGFWLDKWHASPYYATNYAVSALDHFGGASGEGAVSRAVEWVLDTQGRDGSWGIWHPTIDETAHAMHLLLSLDPRKNQPKPRLKEALRHGADFLAACWDATPDDSVHMPLWVGKELYAADRIIRALALSVLHRYRIESEPSAGPSRRISYTENGGMP